MVSPRDLTRLAALTATALHREHVWQFSVECAACETARRALVEIRDMVPALLDHVADLETHNRALSHHLERRADGMDPLTQALRARAEAAETRVAALQRERDTYKADRDAHQKDAINRGLENVALQARLAAVEGGETKEYYIRLAQHHAGRVLMLEEALRAVEEYFDRNDDPRDWPPFARAVKDALAARPTPEPATGPVPSDPARAIATMLAKLDDADKETFNWLIRVARVTSPEPATGAAKPCTGCGLPVWAKDLDATLFDAGEGVERLYHERCNPLNQRTAEPATGGMTRVYLASRFQEAPALRRWADRLVSHGYPVTARWLLGGHDRADTDEDRRRFAHEDLEDIAAADVLVIWSPRKFFGSGRGGRHVEMGYALALGKPIILVGERENIFHWADGITVIEADAGLLPALAALRSPAGA